MCRLRVKDIAFDRGELTIRDGKGGKDRVSMLALTLKQPLADHLVWIMLEQHPHLPTRVNRRFERTRGHDVVVSSHRFVGNSRALVMGDSDGLVKIEIGRAHV